MGSFQIGVPSKSFVLSAMLIVYVVFNCTYERCDALPSALDGPGSHRRSHGKTDLLIKTCDSCVLWDDFGVQHNIIVHIAPLFCFCCLIKPGQPFMCFFPRADICELLAPDLLHQIIKGVFKDHLVEWVIAYLHNMHGTKVSLEIIKDIDHQYCISLLFTSQLISAILGSQLCLHSLVFAVLQMDLISNNGQATTQRPS